MNKNYMPIDAKYVYADIEWNGLCLIKASCKLDSGHTWDF